MAVVPIALGQYVDDITAMEYYIDTDPGIGSGTSISFISGSSVSVDFTIPTASLSPGMHTLVIRVQDQSADWSVHEARAFYVSVASVVAVANITAVEYFFDTDPGFGNGIPVSITAGPSLNIFQSISTSALSPGFHVVHYRARDSDGSWGVTEARPFFVGTSGVVTQAAITALEYFFDADPGYGNGTAIPVTSATSINISALIATTSLLPGFHTIHIRARDADGAWGISEARSFFIDGLSLITAIEYYVDTDPGVGNATAVAVAPPAPSIDMNLAVPTTSLSSGSHTFGVRIKRIDDTWSDVQTAPFTICSLPTADFASDIVCSGSATTFTDNSITVAGDTYQWDFDTNGTIDATTIGSTTFTYPANGSYTATLIIDRSGCADTLTASVQVETLPAANAGINQNICTDNTTLAANAPGAGETGAWTLITGSGNIVSSSNPVSAFTGVTSASSVLQWTLTNTVAGCTSSDQVTIISNQPISASPVITSVSLGQTVNANVQSPAIINTGDVLTTTIITQPKKGGATILSDGTINYSPSIQTVGRDTVSFQLCNQCGRCSANNLIVDILNNAPVIIPDPITVTTGETVTLNLLSIISDPNNNLDAASLAITQQPLSGAEASIDASYNLVINYTNIVFTGTDQLTIQACDTESACASNVISIDVDLPAPVDPPIIVYNAISPNGDEKHDFLEIENINAYPDNHVYIFNRWGDKVFEIRGYDNARASFNGTANKGGGRDLPAGTYYYTIDPGKGKDPVTGYLVLKK